MSNVEKLPHVGSRYLKDRPFLVITVKGNSKNYIDTRKAGWSKTSESWAVSEIVEVVDRVSDRMLNEAAVIIDVANKSLVKHRYRSGDENTVVEQYLERYADKVVEGMTKWKRQHDAAVALKNKSQQAATES